MATKLGRDCCIISCNYFFHVVLQNLSALKEIENKPRLISSQAVYSSIYACIH